MDFRTENLTRGAHSRAAAPPRTGAGDCTLPLVHIVDDDSAFRRGLSEQLKTLGLCIRAYASPRRFLETYQPSPNECLILDLRMPHMTGVEAQREIRRRFIDLPVILVSAFASTPDVVHAVKDGAFDFLEKPIADNVLFEKIYAALAYDRLRKQRRGDLDDRLSRLTDREHEVMQLMLKAQTTHQIAHSLHISPKTVENHRARIFEKMNVASVPELMRLLPPLDC